MHKVANGDLCCIWALPRIGSHSMHIKCGCFDKKKLILRVKELAKKMASIYANTANIIFS